MVNEEAGYFAEEEAVKKAKDCDGTDCSDSCCSTYQRLICSRERGRYDD